MKYLRPVIAAMLGALLAALTSLLAGCASPDAYRQGDRPTALDEELRSRLHAIRDNPSQASPALIRDLQGTLRAIREQQANAGAAQPSPPVLPARQIRSASKPTPVPTPPAARAIAASSLNRTIETPWASSMQAIYASAMQAEQQDKPLQAVALYRHASSLGHALSTKRLMEIYTEGVPGVARNYVAAVKFKQLALTQGAEIDEKYAQ